MFPYDSLIIRPKVLCSWDTMYAELKMYLSIGFFNLRWHQNPLTVQREFYFDKKTKCPGKLRIKPTSNSSSPEDYFIFSVLIFS